MAKPHNPARFGETWDETRLKRMLDELFVVRPYVVVSGGWAWHFMTPIHPEYKHAHDHKDADLFVNGSNLPTLFPI